MPVLPLVGSRIVAPGRNRPSDSAARTMYSAARSFTEPVGLRSSSLAQILTLSLGESLGSPISGVWRPIALTSVTTLGGFLSLWFTSTMLGLNVAVGGTIVFTLLAVFAPALLHYGATSADAVYLTIGLLAAIPLMSGRVWLGALILAVGSLFAWSLLAIGLMNSIMFPTIFANSLRDLGPLTKTASSFLVMSIIGGAVLTALMGVISDGTAISYAMLVPTVCFVVIGWFAWTARSIPVGDFKAATAGVHSL